MALVITDGKQTQEGDWEPLNIASQPLKDAGVDIVALGVGTDVNFEELLQVASSEQNVFSVRTFEKLDEVVRDITSRQCKGKILK